MRRLTTLLIVFALTCGLAAAASFTATEVKIAREVDGPYLLAGPAGVYKQSVIRGVGNNFFLKITLTGGAFDTGSAPITVTHTSGGGSYTITKLSPSGATYTADSAVAEFHVVVVTASTTFPEFTINFAGATLDAAGLADGGSVTALVETRDANTNEPFDLPAPSDTIAAGVWGFKATITADDATIDVGTDRKKFVEELPAGPENDTLTVDNGANADISPISDPVYDASGALISSWTGASENVEVTFSGNLTSITQIVIGASTFTLTAAQKAAPSVTLEMPLSAMLLDPAVSFRVDGTSALATRTLNVALLILAEGNVDNANAVQAATKITEWGINGTVLGVPWVNGNNAFLNSRIYLYNLSSIGGSIVVQAKTMPRVGTASANIGAPLVVGTLPASGTAMIKVAEDVLAGLGITLPYVTDGGNLALEITIYVPNANGLFQTFNSDFGFGTTPCIVIESSGE